MKVNHNGQYFGEWDGTLQQLADQTGWPVSGFSWDTADWNSTYAEKVNQERDRRINSGFTFNNLLYQSDASSRENMNGAAVMAYAAMMNDAPVGDYTWADGINSFFWIAADNTRVNMDAQTTFELGKRAAAWKTSNIYAASDLKKMALIPEDYADNKYWPS